MTTIAEQVLQQDYEQAQSRVAHARVEMHVARARARTFSWKPQTIENIMHHATADMEATQAEERVRKGLAEVAVCLNALIRVRENA